MRLLARTDLPQNEPGGPEWSGMVHLYTGRGRPLPLGVTVTSALPVAHVVPVGHDARPRAQLPSRRGRSFRLISGQRKSMTTVASSMDVANRSSVRKLMRSATPAAAAFLRLSAMRSGSMSTHTPRTPRCLHGGDHDAAIAAAEVVHDVLGAGCRPGQHDLHDLGRGRLVGHVQLPRRRLARPGGAGARRRHRQHERTCGRVFTTRSSSQIERARIAGVQDFTGSRPSARGAGRAAGRPSRRRSRWRWRGPRSRSASRRRPPTAGPCGRAARRRARARR